MSDAIAAKVKRLAIEVNQLASARQITVLNGNSGGNATSLIVPTAVLGTVGYGYLWWKGVSFSDLMYVTKKSMSAAVSNLTKHLEHVSDALAIYLDMVVLVEAQRDLLNNIETQVSNAVDHVQSGTTTLQKAKKLQRNSRKWLCIAIIILLIIITIIVVGVVKPWKINGA